MKKKKEKVIEISTPEELQEDICPVGEPGVIKEVNKDIPEYYVVRVGETLKDVAKKFDLDEKTLKELNGEVIGTNQIKLK